MQNIYEQHRQQLSESMMAGDIAILFAGSAPKSTADAHYNFMTNKNFFYFSGCTQEHFIVAIHKSSTGVVSTLFIEKPDYDIEKWIGRKLTKEAATAISSIENVQYLDAFETWLNRLVVTDKVNRVFLDLEKLGWDEAHSVANLFAKKVIDRYPFVKIETLHPIVTRLRMIKSNDEIEQIKKAIAITKLGLDQVMQQLRPGLFEYQAESIFAHTIRMNGADGNSFPTIAASGGDAVILHYVENNKQCSDGDMILLDLGAAYQEYAADISRTYPVGGMYSDRQKTIYNIVLAAQEATIEAMKPGTPFADLNKVCQETLAKGLIEIGLISDISELGKYYYHGVSHHLGLDVHDLGDREATLEAGMVLTVEPGLYIAEENIGIRIEDDILVTEEGNINLSADIPKTVEAIEKIMNQ